MGNDTGTTNGSKGYRGKIVAYLMENMGRAVNIDRLMEVSGANRHTAQTTMAHLVGNRPAPGLGVETIVRGSVWRPVVAEDTPTTAKGKDDRMFGVIGKTQDGSLVLEATDGTLWKAVQL